MEHLKGEFLKKSKEYSKSLDFIFKKLIQESNVESQYKEGHKAIRYFDDYLKIHCELILIDGDVRDICSNPHTGKLYSSLVSEMYLSAKIAMLETILGQEV